VSQRIGLDLVELDRIRRALARHGRFRERVFTEAERAYCESKANPAESYAARFAGKEAVGKALGCGVHFTWQEIEIVGRPKPSVRLSGSTAAFAERIGAGSIDLSMTHSRGMAGAVAIVEVRDDAHHGAQRASSPASLAGSPPAVPTGDSDPSAAIANPLTLPCAESST
jgi:holo-[acyl-carrier protein] synthase